MNLRLLLAAALSLGGCSSRGCTASPPRPDARASTRPTPLPRGHVPVADPVATVGQALIDLESQLVWADGGAAMTGGRDAWLRAVRSARTPQELAATVVQLERAIGDTGMAEGWVARREPWVATLVTPTPRALAAAVRQLGESVREGHVQAGWEGKRAPWVERLEGVR